MSEKSIVDFNTYLRVDHRNRGLLINPMFLKPVNRLYITPGIRLLLNFRSP